MYAVILAGGQGTRLWPMSREAKPKQLHRLLSEKTMIQETYDRLSKAIDPKNIFISTPARYVDEIKKQLPQIGDDNYIVEPVPKNTAPAFTLIASRLKKLDPDATIATIASDHLIKNVDSFVETINVAEKAIEKYPDHLIAIGINPNFPSTELGYMKIGRQIDNINERQIFEIDKFTEKPDLNTARQYIKSWEYLWNGAYYFFKAKKMLEWMKEYRPNILKGIEEIEKISDKNALALSKIRSIYSGFETEQIEYALVESNKFKKFLAIPADLGWSDIGTWGTLCDVLLENYSSRIVSRGNHIDLDSDGTLVYANNKLIATIGLKDIVVIDAEDVTFIADKTKAGEVKKLLAKLKDEGKHFYL